MFKDFKAFIARGNVIDLAVGVIIGGAFGKIVTSFVNDMLMPLIGRLTGTIDFNNLFVTLRGPHKATLALAQSAGATTLNYGSFINNVVDFLIIAIVIFFMVKMVSKFRPPVHVPETPKQCPRCKMSIDKDATRCPHCTSELV